MRGALSRSTDGFGESSPQRLRSNSSPRLIQATQSKHVYLYAGSVAGVVRLVSTTQDTQLVCGDW